MNNITLIDLKTFREGKYFREYIINSYLTIMQAAIELKNSQLEESGQKSDSIIPQFYSSNFVYKLENLRGFTKDLFSDLGTFFEKTLIFLPLFNFSSKRMALVQINPKKLEAILYVRSDNGSDNSEFSEVVLRLFDVAGEVNEINIEEDEIQGDVKELDVDSEEIFMVYCLYIIECVSLGKEMDFNKMQVSATRDRFVYTYFKFINQ